MKPNIYSRFNSYSPYLFLILALFLLGFAIPPAFSAFEDKEMTAGVPANFPPQYHTDAKTGKPYGFAIDIMDEVASRSGLKIKYVVYANFSDVIAALQKGEIDLVPNLGITQERLNYTDFTAPVETFQIRIFVRSTTNDIKNIDDLAGRKVAVVAQNQGYFIMREKKGVELLVYRSMEEAFMALISGNCDAMVYPDTTLILFARQSGLEDRIKTTGDALAEIKRSIGVRKGQPDLYNKLDETVKAFILTPQYEKILSKWYGEPQPYWNNQRVLGAMGIAVAVVAIVFFTYHYFSVLGLNRNLKNLIEMQKESDIEITKGKNLINAIIEGTTDVVYIKDINGRYLLFNTQASKVTGKSADSVIGKDDTFLFPPNEAEVVMDGDRRVMNSGKIDTYEEIVTHEPGKKTIYLSTKGPIFDENGNVSGLFGIARDITRRKQEEEELKKHREHLEELVKERTAKLNQMNEELEKFNKLFVGRELRMIELKKEIEEIKKSIGKSGKTDEKI